MTEQRKPAPGPAAYFPSIERTYGEPVEHWFELIRAHAPATHRELVEWLKGDYGLGHGHANALVAYVRATTPAAA